MALVSKHFNDTIIYVTIPYLNPAEEGEEVTVCMSVTSAIK